MVRRPNGYTPGPAPNDMGAGPGVIHDRYDGPALSGGVRQQYPGDCIGESRVAFRIHVQFIEIAGFGDRRGVEEQPPITFGGLAVPARQFVRALDGALRETGIGNSGFDVDGGDEKDSRRRPSTRIVVIANRACDHFGACRDDAR